MTTVMYQTPQVVRQQVITTAPPTGGSSFVAEKYMHRAGVGLGITQALLGVISLIFGIVFASWAPAGYSYGYRTYYFSINHHTGAGIWCGILFTGTGVLGILTYKKNKGLIISFMIMSIISAVVSWLVFMVMQSVEVAINGGYGSYYSSVIRGLSGFLVFVAFTEGVIAVISSAFCCHGVCCCSQPSTQGTVNYTVPNAGQNTVAFVAPGQQGFVYYPQQGPQVGGYYPQPMYAQGPPAYSTAQQQQQQQWPQQQPPPQAQQQPVGGATGQQAGPLPQKQ
ncbi:uncharacterized protein LOC106168131 [Lingula anatina]|uniref:Uncharacterized protein LOC106168131 n=1 Tax=Lingula anatina TaxID=7574 RepID=A0A1S3IWG7_LINAN|nr:uncharacterized protein LOC106168131 [Lingula anatina]|eukprot:XP_013402532.1 uncharacterized protein LOC106168131 [Lingula anatina]